MAVENTAETSATGAPWYRNARLNAVRKQLGPLIGLLAITLIFLIFAPT